MEMTELREIPSEFIEPYIVDYISKSLKALAEGRDFDDVDDFKSKMQGMHRFIQHTCGIHARLASDNMIFGKLINGDNDEILSAAKDAYLK